MALYCSREIFEGLEGVIFPATKDDLIDYAELKDAREAVVVALNALDDNMIYKDVNDVCKNVQIACSLDIVKVLSDATFPAKREDLIQYANSKNAPPHVMDSLHALPSGFTFTSADEICDYVM